MYEGPKGCREGGGANAAGSTCGSEGRATDSCVIEFVELVLDVVTVVVGIEAVLEEIEGVEAVELSN